MMQKTDKPTIRFKNFTGTFNYCSFGMALANIYPNINNQKKRACIVVAIVAFCGVQLFFFLSYTFNCLIKLDVFNFTRNMSLWVIVLLYFFKTIYAIIFTKDYAAILDTISNDNFKANDMEDDFKEIYETYHKKGKFGEFIWLVIPILLSSQFPIYAAIQMVIENLHSDTPKKYMVHDMDMVYVEHIQYTSPFYEIYFAYNLTQCIFLSPIFTGFDGSFCIVTNHLCLKLKLMTHKVCKAFIDAKNTEELRLEIKDCIRTHQEVLQFFNDTSEFYGPWLLVLFMVSSVVISFNLYQMYMLNQIVPKYAIFMISGVLHVYVPCAFSSEVTRTAEETAWELYSASWESKHDPVVTKYLTMMIARAQQDMVYKGKGIVSFNMQLFISLMQSAYSFYTLITS